MEDTDYKHVPLKTAKRLECRDAGSAEADTALIKQLGEALAESGSDMSHFEKPRKRRLAALDAYNNWKRERGE